MMRMTLFMLLATVSVATFAEGDEQLWQAIEQLKMRVERLETEAGIADQQNRAVSVNEPELAVKGKVFTRYWLSKNAAFDGRYETPMREGLMSLDSPIKLAPEHYGYKSRGLFDEHNDPSLFPVAAVLIEGELEMKRGGVYQLIVKPTPPREVGGAGNVEVSFEVTVAGETLFAMPFSKSLASHKQEVRIKAGQQPLRIKILARSPGFGPSPTRTEVYIGLQAKGEINSSPIGSYLSVFRQN